MQRNGMKKCSKNTRSTKHMKATEREIEIYVNALNDHCRMVTELTKDPLLIKEKLFSFQIDLWHAATGIVTEAGELMDAVKKHCIYGQALNEENCIEELGDLEFYMQMFRNRISVSRADVCRANIEKLRKRYPLAKFSNKHAKERRDKK